MLVCSQILQTCTARRGPVILNLYLESLFTLDRRLAHNGGKGEITLGENYTHPLIHPLRVENPHLNTTPYMQISRPPCKALGLYNHAQTTHGRGR